MKIKDDSIFFSVVTAKNLEKDYELTFSLINQAIEFLTKFSTVELMFAYRDSKGIKLNKITDRNKEKLYEKLKNNEINLFMIQERMTQKEYYAFVDTIRPISNIACVIRIKSWRNMYWVFSVIVPTEMLPDFEAAKEMRDFFKRINIQLDGPNSCMSRGSQEPTFSAETVVKFDAARYSDEETWGGYVRGYYWGNVLNQEILKKIGGMEKIQEYDFYLTEQWGDSVYIQTTENVMEYTMDDAMKIRSLLKPAFPPASRIKKRVPYHRSALTNRQAVVRRRAAGIFGFILEEDYMDLS